MNKTGHKIWYGVAMFLSGLVLLLSVAGIAGVWITERALANSLVEMLAAMENVAGGLRLATQGVDQKLEQMQAVSTQISTASAQLSQNVTDQGLALLLLPEQQEQKLVELSSSVKETFSTLRGMLEAGAAIYRSIDRLPFVSLPGPSQEQIDKIEGLFGDLQAMVSALKEDIAAFRSGVSDRIGKVEAGANQITSRLGQSRDLLAELDARLAATQEALVRLQRIVVNVLLLAAFLITLLLAWVIYSQVELLRLYRLRWIGSGTESMTKELPDRAVDAENVAGLESSSSAPENPDKE